MSNFIQNIIYMGWATVGISLIFTVAAIAIARYYQKDLATIAEERKVAQSTLELIEKDCQKGLKEFESVLQKKEDTTSQLSFLEAQLNERQRTLDIFKQSIKEQQQQAAELIEKEYDLKRELLRKQKEAEIEEALANLANSQELKELTEKMTELRRSYAALAEESARRGEAASFIETYSLGLTTADTQDIQIISTIEKQLSRKGIMGDILWTVYYQKPLQELRKRVFGSVGKKVCGIYKISLIEDPTIAYIGQAKDISSRWTEHLKTSLKGHSSKFYLTMRKYGPEAFVYEVLEECEESELNTREKYWIEFFKSQETGLNTMPGG